MATAPISPSPGLICFDSFEKLLEKYKEKPIKIASVTACSNVTGIRTDYYKIAKIIHSEEKKYSSRGTEDSREVIIPVIYDGEDVGRIAELHGLKEDEVIKIHSSGLYRIAMIGFKPYFPYLMGLDESLITPRLKTPRVKVPAGSVAIGGEQTGIYPEDSPGGWNIIGRTSPELLKTLRPGDIIKFEERKEL